MGTGICYVIPTWSGPRRWNHPYFLKYNDFYLRAQIDHLTTRRHSHIKHVAVMVPDNPVEAPEFTAALADMLTMFSSGITVEVIRRHNVGMSYGSLCDAFNKYGLDYDYYFFQEDDVVYEQHDFDSIFLDSMVDESRCGFACAWIAGGVEYGGGHPTHAGVGCGLIRASALHAAASRTGGLILSTGAGYGNAEQAGQVGLSQQIMAHNYFLKDFRGTNYGMGFRQAASGGVEYINMDGPHQLLMVKPL